MLTCIYAIPVIVSSALRTHIFHSWHRRYRKRPSFLHFTRPLARRSDRSTINKPVVMVDVVEPNFNAMQKVDLQVESTPGVYIVDII